MKVVNGAACMCDENFNFCNCESHNCPAHNNVIERV